MKTKKMTTKRRKRRQNDENDDLLLKYCRFFVVALNKGHATHQPDFYAL